MIDALYITEREPVPFKVAAVERGPYTSAPPIETTHQGVKLRLLGIADGRAFYRVAA